jgi:hypothetical protein
MVPEVYQVFWAAMAAGEFVNDAAIAAGSYRKGSRWLAAVGGVRPRRGRNLKGRCLMLPQREEIALGRARGDSIRTSLRSSAGHRRRCRGSCVATPMAGADLRTGRAVRRPSRKVGQRKNRIPNMINIAERPADADDRAVPGHWERDLIIGRKNLSAIGTLVERTTSYTMLFHLPDGYTHELVRDALAAKIKTLPEVLRASLWDQGPEMGKWKQVSVELPSISSSATRTRRGSAPRMRTQPACCGSTFRLVCGAAMA